jgi:uncharacterized membrane protein YheB (UPF0754 family)
MEFLGLTLWQWLLPILIGVIAGFTTNAIAIWMLFHPYEAIYLGPLRVLPKGAVPKEIDRIARRIGETVGSELLTPADIATTLASESFRSRFDAVLHGAIEEMLQRDWGSLAETVAPDQAARLQEVMDRVVEKLRELLVTYFASEEWETRVRSFALSLGTDLRGQRLSRVLTPELRGDLVRGATELWEGVRESAEFQRVIGEAIDRAITNLLVSEKPLRHYVPGGAINFGEAFVAQYLPLLLERLGQVLEDPDTRYQLQVTLRRFVDRFLEEQKSWKRVVGRLVITERTLAQTVTAIEQGGVDEISLLLREPQVQARVAQAVNDGLEELLNRPVNALVGEVTPERAARLRDAVVERILYLFRHPTTEQVVIGRLDRLLAAAEGKTVGEVLDLIGPERSRDLANRGADWVVDALRGERTDEVLDRVLSRQSTWLMNVRIGRIGQYLPPNFERRIEQLLLDPLWSFLQARVPVAVSGLPIARMVEDKLKSYPIQQVEALIWRVSRNELVLIIYLGGFLGALVGSLMLLTTSIPAGLLATGFFLLLSFIYISSKG